jgi:hypothetical protein
MAVSETAALFAVIVWRTNGIVLLGIAFFFLVQLLRMR